MSYSISISGHGASEDQVRAATQAALDLLGGTGSASGSYSGSGGDGIAFTGASGMTPAVSEVQEGIDAEAGEPDPEDVP